MKILAIHGFLGLATDWRRVPFAADSQLSTRDLWRDIAELRAAGISPDVAYLRWTLKVISELVRDESVETLHNRASRPLLLGYSLGGRLAMHLALHQPDLFSGAIFVSSHPGLTIAKDREGRKKTDQAWAERFRIENWQALVGDWNAQSVFAHSEPMRFAAGESEFQRDDLAYALDAWSLGRQRDLLPALRHLDLPMLFVAGARDTKYARLLSHAALGSRILYHSVPDCGHRVPWDQPNSFAQVVRDFATRIG